MTRRRVVILVGHGAVPLDIPPRLVAELKRLEAEKPGSPEALAADRRVRSWPRTPRNDPYAAGLKAVAKALQETMKDREVMEAYNEFCSPSLEEAFEAAAANGAAEIVVIPTMFTRGGVHSEKEIPEALSRLKRSHPGIAVRYAWPFDPAAVARMLAAEVRRAEQTSA